MKRICFLSTLFIGIVVLPSCKKDPPVALFLMDMATFKMDEAITFTNQSENAKSYAWDFGDSKKSTDENPTHTYSSTGDFTIKLIATGNGGTDSISKTISVLQNLTGIWLKSLNYTEYGQKITGTMNITQHDDNTLTGSFVYDPGFGFPAQAIPLLPTSYILKDSVSIGWDGGTVFKGLVNRNGKAMGGQLPADFGTKGTWVATKL